MNRIDPLKTWISARAQRLWHRVPIGGAVRFRLRQLVFRHAGILLRGMPVYQTWLEQERLKGDGASASSGRPQRVRPKPRHEPWSIPGDPTLDPRVSVILVVADADEIEPALDCLYAIAERMPSAPIEIILVDDTSTDRATTALASRTDLRYLSNDAPIGRLASLDRGAQSARGKLICFIDPRMIVLDGWLDALVATLDANPDAALVGAKLIDPEGRLAEAGRIVQRDATTLAHGCGADPDAPEYNFMREVDACSSATILTRRDRFLEVGGFDQSLQCIEAADLDLAFALRASGDRVLYQPCSEVMQQTWPRSAPPPCARSGGIAETRDLARLRTKWATALEELAAMVTSQATAADRWARARILIIDACTPTPDQDSGSVDMINYMRILNGLGYRVSFVPETDLQHAGRYTRALQAIGVECLHDPYVRSIDSLLASRGQDFDAVILVRVTTAGPWIERVRAACPRAKIIFDTVDLHFLRERRRAELETGHPESKEAERFKQLELQVIARADATIVVSPIERDLLAIEAPGARVHVIPILREIPGRAVGHAPRRGILFVGGFRHPPNIDAMLWLQAEIWPAIRARRPDIELSIVGSNLNLAPEIATLDGDGIRVLGYVADIDALFATARLSIAPLRYGAGQKGKVVSSLSHGVPCVLTSVAAEGLGLADDEGMLVADDPIAFADAAVRVYEDAELWEHLSMAGLAGVEREFSIEANRERIIRLLADLQLPT